MTQSHYTLSTPHFSPSVVASCFSKLSSCHLTTSSSVPVVRPLVTENWGYGRVYTVAVLTCTFPAAVGLDCDDGHLVVHANVTIAAATFVALQEASGSVMAIVFSARPKYEHLYYESPLKGDLSSQLVWEWMAHHERLFDERSHFVFHDVDEVHPSVR